MTFAGFWSYTHFDDEHEDERITRLRGRIERSIRFATGTEIPIFQDRKDIGWGQKWKRCIDASLDETGLLFPIVTPSFFASAACRQEVLAFDTRQKALGRDDLILPIYYFSADPMDSPDHPIADPEERAVAELLRSHQYEDWRALRGTPETDPAYGAAIERLAQKVKETLKRSQTLTLAATPTAAKTGGSTSSVEATASAPATDTAEAKGASLLRGEPAAPSPIEILTVSPMPGRADFTSITEAVKAARPGARILVAPGHYCESVMIDKPLELIGDGKRDDIVVEATDNETLIFDANIGTVRNLTLRHGASGINSYCVWIKQGQLELDSCDLSSRGLSCLAVMNGAAPWVRRNRIHDGKQSGIFVYEQGRGTFEDNEVYGNTKAGIVVTEGGDPVVRRNRIHDGKASGIFIYEQGRGTFEDNEVFVNALDGVVVKGGGDPVVRRNRIHHGNQSGIFVNAQGRGTFEDNEVFANALDGIAVKEGGAPVVRRNRIHDGWANGIFVHTQGRGTFEDNEVFCNTLDGIVVKEGGDPVVRRNRISRNKFSGIRIHTQGCGTFEDNDLRGNAEGAWSIDDSSKDLVKRTGNQED